MDMLDLKKDALETSISILSEKARLLETEIAAIRGAAEGETKSSAGDKYETGREMMMQESGKLMEQLNQVAKQLVLLNGIDPKHKNQKVTLGSLVKTGNGYYFLGAALGLVKSKEQIFSISTVAPIAQAMLDKKKGDTFNFNKAEIEILEVI